MAGTASNVKNSADDAGWETVAEPYGDTWDFDKNPVLIGIYTGMREVEQDDLNNPGSKRMAKVYEIQTADDGEKVSVWGTYILDEAFSTIEVGKAVRIEYTGKADLDGGRSVRKFKVAKK